MTETEAFKKFQQDTLRSQQSGLRSSISTFQKSSNPLTRLFFAFQNTPLQYMRKINDAVIMYKNGDTDMTQMSKTLFLYGVIAPALNVSVSAILPSIFYFGYEDENKKKRERRERRERRNNKNKEVNQFNDIMSNTLADILVSPIGGVPILQSLSRSLLKIGTDRITNNENAFNNGFSYPVLDDLQKAISKMEKINKKGITIEDFMSVLLTSGETK